MKDYKNRPTFSRNLIKLRKERKWPQSELADKTGLPKRMIAYYETEAIKPPIDKVEIIAKVLKVKISDLLGTSEPTSIQNELMNIDSRTLNKIKNILALSAEERHIVYAFVDSLLSKKQKK